MSLYAGPSIALVAGRMAATRLQALTAGRSIVCREKDRDQYGRTVAICRAPDWRPHLDTRLGV
jgi:hypothetical protein